MGIRDLIVYGISVTAAFTLQTYACAETGFATTSATPLPTNVWSQVQSPTNDTALPVGFYSSGCIRGAVPLALDGSGYQVMRPFRNRFYGHPDLIQFLKNLGTELDAMDSALLLGDLGQPRGGPLPYGHASHQVGLDVDIWYWTHPEQRVRSLTADERNLLPMPSVLNANGAVDPTKFTKETILKLKLASLDPKVERIFVNPAIKAYLCSILSQNELYWLHTLRPWTGHDDHFHVRIACPANGPACVHQEPQAAGDGCKELMQDRSGISLSDFNEETSLDPRIEQLLEPTAATAIPAECANVLKE